MRPPGRSGAKKDMHESIIIAASRDARSCDMHLMHGGMHYAAGVQLEMRRKMMRPRPAAAAEE